VLTIESDDVKHPVRWADERRIRDEVARSIREVVDERVALGTDIVEVHNSATATEQQQTVEHEEYFLRRLVN